MEWPLVFQGVFAFFSLIIATWIGTSIKEMTQSINQLNIKLAVVIERQDSHEHRISKLEDKT